MTILSNIEQKLLKKRIPLTVVFEITKKCNLNCVHCYVNHLNCENELNLTEIKKLIDDLYEMGVMIIALTGGEVFLRKDIFEIIEYIRLKKMGFKIITTGTLLSYKDVDKLKEYGILDIGFSVYSHKKEIHNQITQADSFDKTIDIAKYCAKAGITTISKTPIMTINQFDIEEIHNLMISYGIIPQFDLTITKAENNVRNSQQYALTYKEIFNLLLNENIKNILYNTQSIEQQYCNQNKESLDNPICNIGRTTMFIHSNGDIYPCIQYPYSIGNIKELSIKDIWYNNDKLNKILDETVYKNQKECLNCKLFNYCDLCYANSITENNKSGCNLNSFNKSKAIFEYLNKKL